MKNERKTLLCSKGELDRSHTQTRLARGSILLRMLRLK